MTGTRYPIDPDCPAVIAFRSGLLDNRPAIKASRSTTSWKGRPPPSGQLSALSKLRRPPRKAEQMT